MENATNIDALIAHVDRRLFLPAEVRAQAGVDAPLPIGHGQTNSQPSTVADMLKLLAVRRGQRVLDVGFGSGWTTALLATLVGSDTTVYATERVPELVESGRAHVNAFGAQNVNMVPAHPGVLGWPEQAPFDRILVSAESTELPEELVQQLAPGGIMVIPVAGRMLRVVASRGAGSGANGEHSEDTAPTVTMHGGYRFVPLIP